MKSELKQKWIAALRSGDYEQGVGALRRLSDDQKTLCFCCLGVLCEVAGVQRAEAGYEIHGIAFSLTVPSGWFDRGDSEDTDTQHELIEQNDSKGKSFAEIADWIDANIPAEAE